MSLATLDLELEVFHGPFDLLLTLVLKEELELADLEIAEIVLAFCERFPLSSSPPASFSSSWRRSSS